MDSIAKVNITTQADSAVDEMQSALNDGFSSGKVSKSELLSWIILYFKKMSFDKTKDKIRSDHFDEITHLQSVIEQIKAARRNNEEVQIDQLLAPIRSKR